MLLLHPAERWRFAGPGLLARPAESLPLPCLFNLTLAADYCHVAADGTDCQACADTVDDCWDSTTCPQPGVAFNDSRGPLPTCRRRPTAWHNGAAGGGSGTIMR